MNGHSRVFFTWAAVAGAALFSLLVSLVLKIQSTGAVPGDEFAAAGLLYDALSWLSPLSRAVAAGAAGLLLLEIFQAWAPKTRMPGIVAATALAMAPWSVAWSAPLVIASALVLVSRTARTQREAARAAEGLTAARLDKIGKALSELGPQRLFRWWAALALLSGTGALLVTLTESYAYTQHFAPRLFRASALGPYRLYLAELAVHYGIGLGLAYLLPVGLVRILAKRGSRTAADSLASVVSGTMVLYIAAAAAVHVGDEIWKTGVAPETLAFLMILFIWWRHAVTAAFRDGAFALPGNAPVTPSRIWTIAALAPLSIPTSWLGKRLSQKLRGHPASLFRVGVLAAGIWLWFLVYTSYPELEDFRSEFLVIGVITAVHVVTIGLLALVYSTPLPTRKFSVRTVPLALALCGVLVITGFRTAPDNVALILHEYSRFGYVVKKTSLREIVFSGDDLGEEPADLEFPVHGPGEDRLWAPTPAELKGKRPPIIFVLWDAGRPDRMGCYGHHSEDYAPGTTPNADALAERSVLFKRAYSMSTATTCGVRHIMTGRYSTRYMLDTDHDPFFVHALRRHGYDRFLVTAFGSDYNGVSIDAFLRNGPPPEQDGAVFEHLTRHPRGLDRERPDRVKTESIIAAWRRVHAERGSLDGTFSWLHLTGAHFPWLNQQPVNDFGDDNHALYDGELAKVDALTGQALTTLKELDAFDDAIIVLLADHGTGLMEHGRWAGFLPYEEQVRIPLLVKMPGAVPGHEVEHPVGTIDLAPTLIGLFEPGAPNPYDGVSLLPLLIGAQEDLSRRWMVSLCAFEDAYALFQDGRWKLHYHRSEGYALLFDLEKDPGELHNQFQERRDIADPMIERLGAFLWTGRRGYANPYHYRGWSPP